VIVNPTVYKSTINDSYVVFGEAKHEDLNAQNAQQSKFQGPEYTHSSMNPTNTGAKITAVDDDKDSPVDDASVDTTGVEQKDIELVMQQANVSKAHAVAALKKHDNDIVNAIMVRFN